MSFWQDIPQELLESIIDKIGEDDCALFAPTIRNNCLLQLQLTCKRWSSIAKEVSSMEVFEVDLKLAKKLVSRTKSHRERQQFWRLKKMVITSELALDETLKKLLPMCPYLTHLCVPEETYNTISTKSTDTFDCRERFYITLTELSRHRHLVNLRMVDIKLKPSRTEQLVVRHQQAMLQLRDSLTHLSLVEDTKYHDDHQLSQHFVGCFDTLQDFRWLTSIELHLTYYSCLQDLDSWIQKIGPNVVALCIIVENCTWHRLALEREDPVNVVPHGTSLKLLRLDIDKMEYHDLRYLDDKFGERVSDLQITIYEKPSNIRGFLVYLKKLPNFSIQDMCIPNWRLKDTMMDIARYFKITNLKICIQPNLENDSIYASLKCLAKPQGGNRRQAYLILTMYPTSLPSFESVVCGVLKEDVLEVQICHPYEEELLLHNHEFEACYDQGEAVCNALILLPSLKSLIASYPGIFSLKSILNLRVPKLSLNYLQLGNFTHLPVLFQLSQRVQHIETWVAPEFTYYDVDQERHNYVIRMYYTTFGEIKIEAFCSTRFIVAVCTNSSTTYHGIGVGSNLELPTEEDLEADDDDEEADVEDPDHIGKIVIFCYDVKKVRIGYTTLIIDHP